MHYVYLLYTRKTDKFYIGNTADLKKRFYRHNQGLVISTRTSVPWTLVYYEAYPSKIPAIERERKLKHYGKGLSELKKRLGFR